MSQCALASDPQVLHKILDIGKPYRLTPLEEEENVATTDDDLETELEDSKSKLCDRLSQVMKFCFSDKNVRLRCIGSTGQLVGMENFAASTIKLKEFHGRKIIILDEKKQLGLFTAYDWLKARISQPPLATPLGLYYNNLLIHPIYDQDTLQMKEIVVQQNQLFHIDKQGDDLTKAVKSIEVTDHHMHVETENGESMDLPFSTHPQNRCVIPFYELAPFNQWGIINGFTLGEYLIYLPEMKSHFLAVLCGYNFEPRGPIHICKWKAQLHPSSKVLLWKRPPAEERKPFEKTHISLETWKHLLIDFPEETFDAYGQFLETSQTAEAMRKEYEEKFKDAPEMADFLIMLQTRLQLSKAPNA